MPWQCEGEKRHLIGFLYCRFPSGLISPVSYCVWPVLMVSGDHSIGVFWQRCISSAGHKQVWCVRDEPLHASLVWWRGWYVVSTAGKGRGKFLWNDNSIGRHIKGLLRIEGNTSDSKQMLFRTIQTTFESRLCRLPLKHLIRNNYSSLVLECCIGQMLQEWKKYVYVS